MASLFGKHRLKSLASTINTEDIRDYVELVKTWHNDYHNGTLKVDKETSREQAYNRDFFLTILGYKEKPANPFSFEPKATTEKGQLPDAVLSHTEGEISNIAAVVELKGAGIDLDRPQRREGNMSPVQQGFKYKTQYRNCPFVVVSNFWEFRLYRDNLLDYEVWTLDDLVNPENDYFLFKTWFGLLKADHFVVPAGQSKTENLLSDIRIEQEEIGKKFYKIYREARLELLRDIYKNNSEVKTNIDLGIEKAQKIIDRIVFTCFAEDTGLLPDNTLQRVIKAAESSAFGGSLWNTLKGFFDAIDTGSDKLEIPDGYNGGLFKHDPDLNNLKISDKALQSILSLSTYSFREDLSVIILGHIFEQSISDLEEIKNKVNESQNLETISQSRRKKDGIFYTPDYIVRYIVDNSLGAYLREHEQKCKDEFKLKGDIQDKTYEERERKAYEKYQVTLQNVKVLDPACGSGAFLVYVFDYLMAENRRVASILGNGLFSNDDYIRSILKNNIFGVDLNEESVEITKLSLWLKSAEKGKKLTSLDKNIKCGNSLVEDQHIAGAKAFKWNDEFKDVMESGGFDVIVMNPPYVDSEAMTSSIPEQREYMARVYETTKGNWDLYIPFIEKSYNLIKDNGYVSIITPDKWISKPFGISLREKLLPHLVEVVVAGRNVFHDAKVDSILTTFSKNYSEFFKVGTVEEHNIVILNAVKNSDVTEPYTIDHYFDPDFQLVNKIDSQAKKLSEIAECENACATSDAYKLKDLIFEGPTQREGYMRIINTGTIGRYVSRWGVVKMTYLGNKYLNPVLEKSRFEKEFGNSYYRKSIKPKIIIKGLTLLDVCADFEANVVPGKSTLVITSDNVDNLKFLLAFLNSTLPIYYIKKKYSSASYNGGINFTKDMINGIAIPAFTDSVVKEITAAATELIDMSNQLQTEKTRFQNLISATYGLDSWPKSLSEWWLLDFSGFIKGIKVKLSLEQKDELMGSWEKYKNLCVVLDTSIKSTESKINLRIYDAYQLTEEERKKIELV